MYKVVPGSMYDAGRLSDDLPKDTTYSSDMSSPTRYANLTSLGMNAKQRKRVRTFERLSHLTNLAELTEPGSADAESTLSKQLATMVISGGTAGDIVSARERIARLHSIAKDMLDEVQHLMDDPDGCFTYPIKDGERPQFQKLRDDLFALCTEFVGRAGEPEPMKTAAAERMRQKLEVKLLPKLNAEIPRWAERLRFLHAEVLKWTQPLQLLEERKAIEDAAPEPEEEVEWEAPPESNPRPKGPELELLKSMGWSPN